MNRIVASHLGPLVVLTLVLFGSGAAGAADDELTILSRTGLANSVLASGRLAAMAPSPVRTRAAAWLERIGKETRRGKFNKAARFATDLEATLQVLAGKRAPGLAVERAGLVAGPEDFLPPGDLLNVEVVVPGVLTGGSQPERTAWELLKRKGFRTIVNLRRENNEEAALARGMGFRHEFIAVTDHEAPTREDVARFVAIVDDPANRPVFVHCAAGVGRTHTFIAAWRLAHGTPLPDALAEARAYGHHRPAQVGFLRALASAGTLDMETLGP